MWRACWVSPPPSRAGALRYWQQLPLATVCTHALPKDSAGAASHSDGTCLRTLGQVQAGHGQCAHINKELAATLPCFPVHAELAACHSEASPLAPARTSSLNPAERSGAAVRGQAACDSAARSLCLTSAVSVLGYCQQASKSEGYNCCYAGIIYDDMLRRCCASAHSASACCRRDATLQWTARKD